MKIEEARIISTEPAWDGAFITWFHAPALTRGVEAGQFVVAEVGADMAGALTQCRCDLRIGHTMAGSDKRKQSLYFPEDMLKEIQDEAARQDRSLSWIVQKAWKIARKEIMKYPSVNEFPGEEDTKEIS